MPDSRPTAAARGYNAKWNRTRRRYLRAHPLCECDDPSCNLPATEVHHRDGLGPLGPRGHDPTNLRALTHNCHAKLTAREQPGGWAPKGKRARPAERHPGMTESPA